MKHQLFAGIATGITCLALTLAPIGAVQAQEEAQATNSAQQSRTYDLGAGDLGTSLDRFAEQNGFQIGYPPALVSGKTAPALRGEYSARQALDRLLAGSGLQAEFVNDRAIVLRQTPAATGETIGQRRPGIEEIIVTGQKREERIQDVPIAISAFSMEDLEAQKLEGGFDLVKAIPNVSFTKTNFTSYNFQIRGIGTQATSATTDPGVAVAFNNSAIIQNRLFEQEYLDVERVEVLRGPQGTLYGRNATAGVINVISNKPELGVWDGMIDVEVGNYNTRRLRGHFNMPIGETFAIRGAYASTDREGYTFNSGTGNRVDGRDLWTGRLSLRWQPTDRLRTDFIYERFEEKDDRLRTGKQLCHRDDSPEVVGSTVLADLPLGAQGIKEREDLVRGALFSQGCKPGSLYSDAAFDTPNGLSYNFVLGLLIGSTTVQQASTTNLGEDADGIPQTIIQYKDPYGGKRQSRDLREIESTLDPIYRAEADLFELNVDFDVTDSLLFTSQTAYVEDETFSFQDFNRFNTEPIFTDTDTIVDPNPNRDGIDLAPGGEYCDPQLGCSDSIAGFDIAQASAEQFNQEFRLQSSFAGPLNFSVGANYTKFETGVDYYVFYNLITAMAQIFPFNQTDEMGVCPFSGFFGSSFGPTPSVPTDHPNSTCPHIDQTPVDPNKNFEGDGGHNYFRSKNPYELESWAGFGELYWNIQDDLKLTAGLRYTDDTKTFTPVPSQVLLARSWIGGGVVSSGYPEEEPLEQQWGEWTGRLVLDWQPVLDFTDETLVYASFSRGYKGGGANPPTPDFANEEEIRQAIVEQGLGAQYDGLKSLENLPYPTDRHVFPILGLTAVEYGRTFKPEFVNAYELGTKNTLFDGALTLNATAFYYDYTDYQVSQIRDRTAVNENFDAEMWGLELETVFAPSPNWQFLANVGYLQTKIAEGETSIDIMNRTQGHPDYTLMKPWAQLPSNCVVPTDVVEGWLNSVVVNRFYTYVQLCDGVGGILEIFYPNFFREDPLTGTRYDPAYHDGVNEGTANINGGAGIRDDVGGNELPNSPNLTVTLGGQYSFDLTSEWRATTRIDYYWQDESYHRIYNTEPYDRLKSWSNTNLSFWVNNANSGITVEAYVKNLFNQTPITGAFLNSDDTGLTTNVFMMDPRLIGVSVRKEF